MPNRSYIPSYFNPIEGDEIVPFDDGPALMGQLHGERAGLIDAEQTILTDRRTGESYFAARPYIGRAARAALLDAMLRADGETAEVAKAFGLEPIIEPVPLRDMDLRETVDRDLS